MLTAYQALGQTLGIWHPQSRCLCTTLERAINITFMQIVPPAGVQHRSPAVFYFSYVMFYHYYLSSPPESKVTELRFCLSCSLLHFWSLSQCLVTSINI